MRTDAKIGFAIGGVLLAVLTVYAIVVPKHTTKKTGTVALVSPTPTGSDTPAPPSLAGTSDGSGAPGSGISGSGISSSSANTQIPSIAHDNGSAAGLHTDQGSVSLGQPGPLPGTPGATDLTPGGANHDGHEAMLLTKPDDKSTDVTAQKPGSAKHQKSDRPKVDGSEVADGSSASDRSYTIKSGQTLSSIANEVYGNSRFFVAIQRENRGLDPMHLKPGMKIKLPDITPVEPASDTIIPPNGMEEDHVLPLVQVTPRATGTSSMAISDGRTYTVKSGDNLYAIARRLLGSGRKAEVLYELNKDVIGPDKGRLKLGMLLKLPEAAHAASPQ
jgi:LysM repeat protein